MDETSIVDDYVGAWNEKDAERRRTLLERSFGQAGSYQDPLSSVSGREALCEHIAGYQQRFPDSTMERTSGVDGYRQLRRFAWAIVGPQGDVAIHGVDIVTLDDDGLIRSVTGFFGDLA